ncbi:response regulator [Ponticaulis profundi]|uniref:Response regulator n=1 Tax=Ponticaulis profundi TaxID=2665222 RepID=A0ABW1S5P4_9PROT
MHIHYVEDDNLDAILLTQMAKVVQDLDIRVSRSLGELREQMAEKGVDCVLLDVIRPDARSLEDDIRRIREMTDAPIVFITGNDAEDMRNRALRAGAKALIEKATVSSEVLKQIFYNLGQGDELEERASLLQTPLEPDDEFPASILPNHNLDRLNLSMKCVQETLRSFRSSLSEDDRFRLDFVDDLMDDLRSFAQSDLTGSSRVPLSVCLLGMEQKLRNFAEVRGVDFELQLEESWHTQIGSDMLTPAGLFRLIAGCLMMAEADDHVHLRLERTENGSKLAITSNRRMVQDVSRLFETQIEPDNVDLAGFCSMQVGLLLLGVGSTQVVSFTDEATQHLVVFL